MKNILKEITIFILIIAAIVLVLGVLFYDYIPTSKVIPQTVSYQTPENLQAEISDEAIEDSSGVLITYEIGKDDLNIYQDKSSYIPGKQNPFDEYSQTTGSATGTDSNEAMSDEEFFNNNKTK